MDILVVGASGATGQLLVGQLLDMGHNVRVIVRSKDRLPERIRNSQSVSVVEAAVLDLSDQELQEHTKGCGAVASCLGHNMTASGIWGGPRLLCRDATHRLCEAVTANAPDSKVKFVLMNTTGNPNQDLKEHEAFTWGHKSMLSLLRNLIPPQWDNELAAEHLRARIGKEHKFVDWVVVRPDGLIDHDAVTPYSLHESPVRDCLFDPGQTTRINVANFMADLISNDKLFAEWRFGMPVIYNSTTIDEPEK